MNETIIVLGGAGYIGWALSLRLANINKGKVIIVDNLLKQNIIESEHDESLIPWVPINEKIDKFKEIFNKNNLIFEYGDISEKEILNDLFKKYNPDIIINYAQLPSAPFSLKNEDSAVLVTNNNVNGNLRVLWAMKKNCPDAHLIKMSTMGIYGTNYNFDVPEDKLEIEINNKKHNINYPYDAGSIYHWAKVFETQHCNWLAKLWNLKITDIAQGIVFGVGIEETLKDKKLNTSFYYSGTWGTLINRFVTQSLINYPLTVYGSGNQVRGLISLKDAIKCVELYINNPPNKGEYRRFNQLCEQEYKIKEIAQIIQKIAKKNNYKTTIKNIENPRKEKENHYYNIKNNKIKNLGLEMSSMDEEIDIMFNHLSKYKNKIKKEMILPKVKWKK